MERITERLGRERVNKRDADVEAFKARTLKATYRQAPEVAAIHLDAGKIQLRQDGGGPGVREPHWGDTKVGCFLTYTAISGDIDPQPEPPAAFLDPPQVMRLCREMEKVGGQFQPCAGNCEKTRSSSVPEHHRQSERPKRLVRTAVATTEAVGPFGWMVAAEAGKRGFYRAKRKAIVGDGGNWIGPLAEEHFPGWRQVLDFMHLLVHLYAAAAAAHKGRSKKAWGCYKRWLCWAWAGEVEKLIGGLKAQSIRLGAPPDKARDDDPRRVVALTLEYVKANSGRMDYKTCRMEGLPITSAPVESLIKQLNQRVKGTEKFWLEGGAEAVLQSRAAYLSEDGRAEDFHKQRPPGYAVGKKRFAIPA